MLETCVFQLHILLSREGISLCRWGGDKKVTGNFLDSHFKTPKYATSKLAQQARTNVGTAN